MPPDPEPINFAAMTVNQRFFAAGLMDQWDEACQRRDRAEMIALLKKVEVSQPEFTVEHKLRRMGPAT